MSTAPLPVDEPARLTALERYEILGTPPEEAFDALAALAANIYSAPVALVTFLDEDKQWFKAHYGTELTTMPREKALCAHVILSDDVIVVADTTKDERFFDNPNVTGETAVRFYAGVPLITPSGHRIGSLCVLDVQPRDDTTPAQARALKNLAKLVTDELELRKALSDAVLWQDKFLRSERLTRSVFDAVDVGLCVCDASGRFTEVNEAYCRLSGYSAAELVGQPFTEIVPPPDREAAFENHRSVIRGGQREPREGKMLRKDGTVLTLWITGKLFETPDGRRHRVASLTDLSEVKNLQCKLAHMAFHDTLTGLPNRAYSHDLLAQAQQGWCSGELLAVLQLNLDNFKTVNDTRGHGVGDKLLVEVAGRLRRAVQTGDTVARWAGDEFFVLATGLIDAEQAELLAERVLEVFRRPFWVAGSPLLLSASVGVVVQRADTFDEAEALKQADLALCRAKETRNTATFFTQELQSTFSERHALEQDLRDAVESASLTLFYQPRVNMISGQWRSVEALLHWQHPARGMVSPGIFVPLAEESDLILKLGAFVLDEACAQAARWHAAGTPLRVAVNVSAKQLMQNDFVDTVLTALERYGLPAPLLEIEITETAFILDVAASSAKLKALQQRGLHIAMDDFGTGYSSLSALTQLPLDALKIDKSFVDRVSSSMSRQDRVVIETVVALGSSLGLELIAEGVETAEQKRHLLGLGCIQAQGYLFARPTPAHELTTQLAQVPQEARCA